LEAKALQLEEGKSITNIDGNNQKKKNPKMGPYILQI